MSKTAKVQEVVSIREYDGKFGKTFFHKVVMDNGDTGDIGKKVSGAVKVGDELNYELETGEFGNKIKPIQSNGFGGNGFKGGAKGSSASFALAYAKDVMVAAMPLHPEVPVSQWVDVAITTAGKFQKFLKENE